MAALGSLVVPQKLNRMGMFSSNSSSSSIPQRTENRNLTQGQRYPIENVVSGIVIVYGDMVAAHVSPVCRAVTSLCCTPETSVTLGVDYASVTKGKWTDVASYIPAFTAACLQEPTVGNKPSIHQERDGETQGGVHVEYWSALKRDPVLIRATCNTDENMLK